MKKEDCIFCRIANGEIPSRTLFEDAQFRVILDLGPAAKGHAEDQCRDAFALARKMAVRMKEKLGCDGFNLVQNNGEAAGQTVPHFHIHLIPRYRTDGQTIGWKPGNPSPEELDAVKELLCEED